MTSAIPEGEHRTPGKRRWRLRRWRWLALGVLLPVALIGGWVVWSFVRPNPRGFAPTILASEATISVPTTSATGETPPPAATATPAPPPVLQFTVDARSRRDWVYFNFEQGTVVETARDALDWDLAFRRNRILTNSGATNPAGGGGALDLGEVSFAEASLPTRGFAADVEDEERGLENPELHKWYNYNWTTHIISSKDHTYAVRSADGAVYLFKILSYYCDDRSPACVTFLYQRWEGD